MADPTPSYEEILKWEIDVPLATNRVVLRQLALLIVIPSAALALLMLTLGVIESDPGQIKVAFILFCAGIGFMSLLIGIAILLVLGNRMRMTFRVDEKGVQSSVIDRRAKTSRMLAILIGALTVNPGLAGAGLLAQANSGRDTIWSEIEELEIIDNQHTIVLRSGLMVLDAVFCTSSNFQRVRDHIEAHIHSTM